MKNQSEDGLIRFGVNVRGTMRAEHVDGATCFVRAVKFDWFTGRYSFEGYVMHSNRVRMHDLAGMESRVLNGETLEVSDVLRDACESAFSFAAAAWEHQDRLWESVDTDTCPERS